MLEGMPNVLRGKHEDGVDGYGIMESLQRLFGRQSSRAKYVVMKAIVGSKQKPETLVREHVLNLTGLLNEIKVNEGTTNTFTQVVLIMNHCVLFSLPSYLLIL